MHLTAWYDDSIGGMEVLHFFLNLLHHHFLITSSTCSSTVHQVLRLRNVPPPAPQRVDDKEAVARECRGAVVT